VILAGLIIWIRKLAKEIRARQQAEEALRESQEKYQHLIETTDTGYVIIDHQGRVTDANHEYARLTGRPRREEVLGHSVLEWTAPHDHERNEAAVRRCVEQGLIRNLEVGYVTPSGQVTPVEINATVLGHGASLQILSLCRDITERKRAEEALRESEKKYRTLIQKIQTAVIVHGPDTRILTCNPMAQELLGLTEAQLLGKTTIDKAWHFFNADGTKMGVDEYPVNQVIARRRALRNIIAGVHRPNKEQENDVWVLINADPIFVNYEIVQVIVTFIDITERKRAEEALRESEKNTNPCLTMPR
jgi:PAS domain S-box-containing protein